MVERKKIGDSEREVICMYLYVALIKIQLEVISNVRKILIVKIQPCNERASVGRMAASHS